MPVEFIRLCLNCRLSAIKIIFLNEDYMVFFNNCICFHCDYLIYKLPMLDKCSNIYEQTDMLMKYIPPR